MELDRQITLLEDRNTPRFLPGAMALYGGIEAPLMQLADEILKRTAPAIEDDEDDDDERQARRKRVGTVPVAASVGAHEFARRAQDEIDFYRAQYPELSSKVEVRDDVPGVMVAAGQLLIAENFTYPAPRLEALIQHEVGTHIVSHANGKAQPLKLLYIGFPDYDPLQEGTALLAEWLSGGLHPLRLRLLAARVWAVNALIGGADFIETFRALHDDHGFFGARQLELDDARLSRRRLHQRRGLPARPGRSARYSGAEKRRIRFVVERQNQRANVVAGARTSSARRAATDAIAPAFSRYAPQPANASRACAEA